VSFWCIRIT